MKLSIHAYLWFVIIVNAQTPCFAGTTVVDAVGAPTTRQATRNRYLEMPNNAIRQNSKVLSASDEVSSDDFDELNDRCRAIVEFAQLGDHDERGLDELRHACG
jgi:hypothetical protein